MRLSLTWLPAFAADKLCGYGGFAYNHRLPAFAADKLCGFAVNKFYGY